VLHADVWDESYSIGDASNILMEDLGRRLGSLLQVLPDWMPSPANLRRRRAVRRLDDVVYRMIADRRRSDEDRGDLLSILLHAQDADDGSTMTNQQVRSEERRVGKECRDRGWP